MNGFRVDNEMNGFRVNNFLAKTNQQPSSWHLWTQRFLAG